MRSKTLVWLGLALPALAMAQNGNGDEWWRDKDKEIHSKITVIRTDLDRTAPNVRQVRFVVKGLELYPIFGVAMNFYGVNPVNGKVYANTGIWEKERPDLFELSSGGPTIDSAEELRAVLKAMGEAARTSRLQPPPREHYSLSVQGALQYYTENGTLLEEKETNFGFSKVDRRYGVLTHSDLELLGAPKARDVFEAAEQFELFHFLVEGVAVNSETRFRKVLEHQLWTETKNGQVVRSWEVCRYVDTDTETVLDRASSPKDEVGFLATINVHPNGPSKKDRTRNLNMLECREAMDR